MLRRIISFFGFGLLIVSVLISCSSQKAKYGMRDGPYEFRQAGGRFKKVDVYLDSKDSIRIFEQSKPATVNNDKPQYFRLKSFDLDAVTVPFKFRPGSPMLPRQLTTDFNGNIYLGYRIDRFKLTYQNTLLGLRPKMNHIGFSGGVFGGLGSTSISSWTTNNRTTDEYNGLILSRGLAFLVGINSLTFGVGVGWDYLTDRDKNIWIYQNKPWYGLTVGLNVN